ncbi:MAG: cupredoxin family copper-binding protein [Candidatus Paceibacterota bacterium]
MNKKIIIIVIAVIALAVLAFVGISSTRKKPEPANVPANTITAPVAANENTSATAPAQIAAAQTYQISIKNFAFSPASLNVKKGDTVVWTNEDGAPHQIAGSGFKSEVLQNGATYGFTFTEAGGFSYICSLHPSMKGEITVGL